MEKERNGARVLIVDDEEAQRTALAGMVALWGYTVETAANGQEALDKIPTFNPHVVVSDMMMPVLDGTELLKRLKAQGGGPPVIIETAFGDPEKAIATVHDNGAYWFLEKPVQARWLRLLLEGASNQARLVEHT